MSEPLIPADVNESAAEQTASLQRGGPTQDFKPAGAHPLAPPLPTFMCPATRCSACWAAAAWESCTRRSRKVKGAQNKKARERSFPYREALCLTCEKAGLHAGEYATRKKCLSKADEMSKVLHDERSTSRNRRWPMPHKLILTKDGEEQVQEYEDIEQAFNAAMPWIMKGYVARITDKRGGL
jgi:hypothetical protein